MPAPFFIQRSIEGLIVKLINQFSKEVVGSFSQCWTIWFYWITHMWPMQAVMYSSEQVSMPSKNA